MVSEYIKNNVNDFTRAMTINEVKPYIVSHIKLNELKQTSHDLKFSTLCLSGPPGIGKSDGIEQICKENGWGLCVYYMATMMLEQLTGLPKATISTNNCLKNWFAKSLQNLKEIKDPQLNSITSLLPIYVPGKELPFTEWTIPELFSFRNIRYIPKGFDFDKDTMVLLLDDIHLVNKTMQSYLFQLLTYRSINSHKLPDNVVIITAGNRGNDRSGFQQMLAPITNRMYFLDLTADVDDWFNNFAIKYGVRFDIITFLQNNESAFLSTPLENQPWGSPRSWTYGSDALNAFEKTQGELKSNVLYNIMKGHVGEEFSGKYVEYITLMLKFDANKSLNNPEIINYEKLSHTENYALMSVCVLSILKDLRIRYNNTGVKNTKIHNDDILRVNNLKILLENICKKSRVVIPIGLKTLVRGEEKYGEILITKKIIDDSSILKNLLSIV